MPGKMSKEEVDAFLDSKPGWMMLTSQGRDGYPHTVPIGYFRDGDRIFMGCRDNTQKVKNIERNPKVSLVIEDGKTCLLYTSPSPRDAHESRMPSSA